MILDERARKLSWVKAKTFKNTGKIGMVVALISLLWLSSMRLAYGESLNIALSTTKPTYTTGERIIINGNLTLNQNPVSDGLVTIQVNDPRGNLRIIRTRQTGVNITQRWPVEILNLVPTSAIGDATYNFKRGDYIGFNITIRNNDLVPHDVNVTITIYYPDEVPIRTSSIYIGTLEPEQTLTRTSFPFARISDTAPLGTAVAYANVLHPPLPQFGGWAYSPEKSVAFNISLSTTSSTGSEPPQFQSSPLTATEGTFNLTFNNPRINARLGNYTAYATSFYTVGLQPYFASTSITFEVTIIGDLNGDGECDIRDISIVARAYGSYPGKPNWNPIADVYPDLEINIRDVSIVARDYGKSGVYP